MKYDFPSEQTCPKCGAKFTSAELKEEYVQGSVSAGEAPVVSCPQCSILLWRPGLDTNSPLFPFDPSMGEESI